MHFFEGTLNLLFAILEANIERVIGEIPAEMGEKVLNWSSQMSHLKCSQIQH